MRKLLHHTLRRTPYLWRYAEYFRERFPGSATYWEARYARGGNSGAGSYHHLAEFKAEVLNGFIAQNGIESVIEFGCGDGNQLHLSKYPRYVGLDVSRSALKLCIERFKEDSSKSFFLYEADCFSDAAGILTADLALSLDVIYHLVEDRTFARYMADLFHASRRFVIVYSSDHDELITNSHVRHRRFSAYVAENFPEWTLRETIKNRYSLEKAGAAGSFADFFIFARG